MIEETHNFTSGDELNIATDATLIDAIDEVIAETPTVEDEAPIEEAQTVKPSCPSCEG